METRKLSLVFAISGFIYTTVLFFIFLLIFKIYDLASIFQNIKDYLPYLSVITFFLSFVIGMISESIVQKFVFWLTKKSFDAGYQVKLMKYNSEVIRNSLYYSYDRLVILRHFVVGLFFLVLFSSLWILSSDFVDKGKIISYILASGGSVLFLSVISYIINRINHSKLVDEVEKLINKLDQ